MYPSVGNPLDQGLGSWPWRRARITPDRIALSQGGRRRTYGELAHRVAQLAGALAESGVRHGDRVAYLGANDVATFETFFACGTLGAVFVPLNTRLAAAELRFMLADCTPEVLVHSRDTDHVVRDLLPLDLRRVLALHPQSCPAGGDDYEATLLGGQPARGTVGLQDAALILYTSGTTGRPKGAVLSHGNLTWNTINQLAHFDTASTDRALCIAPLFHVVGLGQVTLPTLFKGGQVEVVPSFDATRILELIAAQRITSFSAVPTMLQMICESPAWENTDLSSMAFVVYGGSPVQERVAKAWLARGVQLLQGYGMTEASPGVYMASAEGSPQRPTSVGQPHFFTDIAHLDTDPAGAAAHDSGSGSGGSVVPVEPNQARELLIRGPNVFTRYWKRPAETEQIFLDGEWFRTGDVVRVGDDGWAYVVDRVKDMIISGGENIYPAEVEAVLVQLDEIASAAVIAVPDERWGEVGMAFVQLRPGTELADQRLREHLAANLAKYKIPKYFRFVDALPRNASGKVLRRPLRELADEKGHQ